MLNNQRHSVMLIDWRGYYGKKNIEPQGRRSARGDPKG